MVEAGEGCGCPQTVEERLGAARRWSSPGDHSSDCILFLRARRAARPGRSGVITCMLVHSSGLDLPIVCGLGSGAKVLWMTASHLARQVLSRLLSHICPLRSSSRDATSLSRSGKA